MSLVAGLIAHPSKEQVRSVKYGLMIAAKQPIFARSPNHPLTDIKDTCSVTVFGCQRLAVYLLLIFGIGFYLRIDS